MVLESLHDSLAPVIIIEAPQRLFDVLAAQLVQKLLDLARTVDILQLVPVDDGQNFVDQAHHGRHRDRPLRRRVMTDLPIHVAQQIHEHVPGVAHVQPLQYVVKIANLVQLVHVRLKNGRPQIFYRLPQMGVFRLSPPDDVLSLGH